MKQGVLTAVAGGLLVLLATAGCRTTAEAVAKTEFGTEWRDEIRLGDALLGTMQRGDYPAFAALLPDAMRRELTEKDFDTSLEALHRQFGEIRSFRCLTPLRTPLVGNLLWAVACERKGSDGKPVEQEILYRQLTGRVDGKVELISFTFQ